MKFDVIIAGGGFAGAYCAKSLAKALGREEGERRVALIAERNVLVFHPMLAEVAGSSLSPMDVVNPLRQFCRGANVLKGEVRHVDWERKEVVLDGGRFTRDHRVGFNHLVLALGSVTDLSRVPGMAEYGRPLKDVAEALRLRAAVINRLEEANLVSDPEVRARLLTFVVVGGGYTGVEVAGQLHDLVHDVRPYYANLRGEKLRVVLVHSREQLLQEIGPRLGEYARCVLAERGIEIRLGSRVAEVTASKVIFEGGEFIETHTVVSTIGNAPNPVIVDLCRHLGIKMERGRVPVEPTMRVPGFPELWSAGDCAAVPWNNAGEQTLAPPTAQFAQRQGKQLGENLARALRGEEPRPFTYRYMGQMASIGRRQAVAEVFGKHFRGFIAWWMWRTIYLAKLPGLARKLRVVMDWTFDLIFPRDISVVMPPPEDILRAIHLEPGEVLFGADDRVTAFFFIDHGEIEVTPEDGRAPVRLGAGEVIDDRWLAEDGTWSGDARAVGRADLVVFRGRALELVHRRLRLVPREEEPERR